MRGSWIVVVALASAGCSGGKPDAAQADRELRRQGLAELGEAYKDFVATKKRTPNGPADFRQIDVTHPEAGSVITSDLCVFLYGGPAGADPNTVLAYEKEAPQSGGLALMQDGTVKTMTAAEFAAAPKAGKK